MKREHFGAGAVAATCTCVLLQPLDVYKTRVQELKSVVQPSGSGSVSLSSSEMVKSMLQKEGIGAFWKGTIPTLFRNVPGTSMYFGMFQAIKGIFLSTAGDHRIYDRQVVLLEKAKELKSNLGRNPFVTLHIDEDATEEQIQQSLSSTVNGSIKERRLVHVHYTLSDTAHMITGGVARTMVGTLFMPITVMKVRLESSQYQYKSIFDASRSIYKEDGPKGFFKGVVATALRDAPFAGIYVVVYEKLKLLSNSNNTCSA